MRYPASEKLEIIRTVEASHMPTKQTLDKLGIPRTTFYRWYDLYLAGGLDGLSDKLSRARSLVQTYKRLNHPGRSLFARSTLHRQTEPIDQFPQLKLALQCH